MAKKALIVVVLILSIGLALYLFLNRSENLSTIGSNLRVSDAQSCSQKLTDLASTSPGRLPKVVEFSQTEVEAYLHYELSKFYPPGLKKVHIRLSESSVSASARLDFDQIQMSGDSQKNSLVSALFQGEHDLELVGQVNSRNKVGSYNIQAIRLDQSEIPKPLVDLLITKFVLPKYPRAKPNSEFDLPYDIERIEIKEGKLVVYQGGT